MTHDLIDPSLWAELEEKARTQFQPNQGLSFGPFLFGYAADGFAYGLLALQVLQWYTLSYRTESRIIRILVIWTFLLSTVYTILTIRYMLNLFAYGFDIYRNFYNFSWVSSFFLLSGLIQAPISCFFAHRAYILSGKSNLLAWIIFPIVLAALVICISLKATAPSVWTQHLVEDSPATMALTLSWLSLNVLRDIAISVNISWCLLKGKSEVKAFEQTDRWIKKAIIIFMEAQFAPTIFGLAFMISFIVMPQSNLSAFFLCTPKVYAITLMGALNARHFFNRELVPPESFRIDRPITSLFHPCASAVAHLLPRNTKSASGRYRASTADATQTEIHVETESVQQTYQLEPLQEAKSINRDPQPYTSPYSQDLGGASLQGGIGYYGHRSRKRESSVPGR
uniref:DUF6534 domain-containing protein n=1 Tax=Kwoniella dejecticola CBS 10117 TaxID=1296121 RepID=A0A1A6ADQ7_9TREE|nr:uncharacterized protein I303_00017 [Kwoniella dejecticola CBS 10117]OBR88206.1 hypothetical protein I303_00017 [Kwoniella dejecticola CBS 10117]